jgi:hypothetical protein
MPTRNAADTKNDAELSRKNELSGPTADAHRLRRGAYEAVGGLDVLTVDERW